MQRTALIIFAKRPALGKGKQRLANETSKETALLVAEELLKHTLDSARDFDGDIILSPSSPDDSDWSHNLLERATLCIPQRSGGLGKRLQQVDREARMLGYEKTIFIGTDAPTLSLQDLVKVQHAFDAYSQVFIPATDGGVILMATRTAWKHLDTVEWSTEKVFTQLKSIAIAQGLSFRSFAEQTDLDDLTAFKQLQQTLAGTHIHQQLQDHLK